jgi:hypothetical protein
VPEEVPVELLWDWMAELAGGRYMVLSLVLFMSKRVGGESDGLLKWNSKEREKRAGTDLGRHWDRRCSMCSHK